MEAPSLDKIWSILLLFGFALCSLVGVLALVGLTPISIETTEVKRYFIFLLHLFNGTAATMATGMFVRKFWMALYFRNIGDSADGQFRDSQFRTRGSVILILFTTTAPEPLAEELFRHDQVTRCWKTADGTDAANKLALFAMKKVENASFGCKILHGRSVLIIS
jgi:hypothetical protein